MLNARLTLLPNRVFSGILPRRNFSNGIATCFVICLTVCGPSAFAETLSNNDFESVTNGLFDNWSYYAKTTGGSVTVDSGSVIHGSHSAELLAGSVTGGWLYQSVGTVTAFEISLDFAILDTVGRSFGLCSYGGTVNVSVVNNFRINKSGSNSSAVFGWNNGTTWTDVSTLVANTTADIGGDKQFGDGENLVINHLTLVGTNYGSSSHELVVTLNGASATFSGSTGFNTTYKNKSLQTVSFYSASSDSDFLVDNYQIPEPNTLMILVTGGIGLLAYAWRRHK
jgi:hypothetical protein